ncbi:hypothetical protein COI69_00090 [Bacillus cereus]|uniref:Uncharacterized protein n=1 Tax=Bacillus cereus TaxID=1396 RepID=A0A9X7EBN3_BACCE|nr:hypothetical protein [Bacillus cereus]PHA21817.1 hypothetical protein COE70_11785 [Bacillus cereus]PHG84718.1 hypothetical protein COI69_00090 [Bacillus cereus]
MKTVQKKHLKTEFKSLQILNNEFSRFIQELEENHNLSAAEIKTINSMKEYFSHTSKLFVNLENLCS